MTTNTFEGPGPDAQFAEILSAGDFRIQRCGDCNAHIFHPRPICPECGSGDLSWVAPSGDGTIYAKTIVHRRAEKGGDYNVVLVDLAEGVRMMSRVEGVEPADITTGMAVQASIGEGMNGEPAVVFTPTEAAK
ncbi:MAG: OB-fold domain-containing protein [Marinosulfonomonas sp.]|nr:OB-fold domain-containing protein [Marinosulfonomonas sp.]